MRGSKVELECKKSVNKTIENSTSQALQLQVHPQLQRITIHRASLHTLLQEYDLHNGIICALLYMFAFLTTCAILISLALVAKVRGAIILKEIYMTEIEAYVYIWLTSFVIQVICA